jgi:hypothetical protein
MNSNRALIMFAVIAAFGLTTATLVVMPQAYAVPLPNHPSQCHNFFSGSAIGQCARDAPKGKPITVC